jgi:hypothetical protein
MKNDGASPQQWYVGDLLVEEGLAIVSGSPIPFGDPTFEFASPDDTFSGGSYHYSGGYINFDASDANSPYITVTHRIGGSWEQVEDVVRLGNLNGYLDIDHEVYGFGVGNIDDHIVYTVDGLSINIGSGDISIDATGVTSIAYGLYCDTPSYVDQVAYLYFFNDGGVRQLRAKVKDGVYTSDILVSDFSGGGTVPYATITTAGIVTLAVAAEVTAGIDNTKVVTPRTMSQSDYGKKVYLATFPTSALITNFKCRIRIPSICNGYNLVGIAAMCATPSSSGTPTFTVTNITKGHSMLSTNLTIDVGEYDSLAAAVPPVIDTSWDDVATADQIELACTVAGTGTAYAAVELTFQLP